MSTQQWEYLIAFDDGTFTTKIDGVKYEGGILEFLNQKGKEGWELCAIDRTGNYFLKRPTPTVK